MKFFAFKDSESKIHEIGYGLKYGEDRTVEVRRIFNITSEGIRHVDVKILENSSKS